LPLIAAPKISPRRQPEPESDEARPMPFMPFQILGIWFRGLLSIAILVGGIYLLTRWYDASHVQEPAPAADATGGAAPGRVDGDRRKPPPDRVAPDSEGRDASPLGSPAPAQRVFRFDPGWNRPTAYLTAALALLTWALAGSLIARGLSKLASSSSSATSPSGPSSSGTSSPASPRSAKVAEVGGDPKSDRGGEVHTIRRPDGTVLRVECHGPPDAPPMVLTHGWGADSTAWYYSKLELAKRFRLIVWDEPGLGLSKKPDDNDFRLEKMAADLGAVLTLAGGRPAVLVGHSIGGMIILTFCKLFPDALGPRVSGLVLAHTSYTNPVRTTKMAALCTALEKPVLVPLLHLTIWTWPLVIAMNWLSLINGSAYRSTKDSSFGGTETPGQVEFVARFLPTARPDVVARGMFGMLAYDATAALATIPIPALVIVGDQDTTTVPEAGHFMAKNIPKAELATLAPAKHMGLIEHHGRFNQLVAEFVDARQAGAV